MVYKLHGMIILGQGIDKMDWDDIKLDAVITVKFVELGNPYLDGKTMTGKICQLFDSNGVSIVKIDVDGIKYRVIPDRDILMEIL